MAEKDKKRFDLEMQSYIPPKGEKVRGRKRKQIKDPNAPKRSLWVTNGLIYPHLFFKIILFSSFGYVFKNFQ